MSSFLQMRAPGNKDTSRRTPLLGIRATSVELLCRVSRGRSGLPGPLQASPRLAAAGRRGAWAGPSPQVISGPSFLPVVSDGSSQVTLGRVASVTPTGQMTPGLSSSRCPCRGQEPESCAGGPSESSVGC